MERRAQLRSRLVVGFAVVAYASLFATLGAVQAASATSDPMPCFSVPSHYTGQQNPDKDHSYHVELRFEWDEKTDDGVLATFLGADGNEHGPFDVTVSMKNHKVVFVDNGPTPTTFTLRCGQGGTLEAQLSQANQGGTAHPTGTISFKRLAY